MKKIIGLILLTLSISFVSGCHKNDEFLIKVGGVTTATFTHLRTSKTFAKRKGIHTSNYRVLRLYFA